MDTATATRMKDLYKILGVPESADEAAIKGAYRKLAKEYHPDVTGGDKRKTERFKEINEAYSVLGDADKRGEYDRLRKAPLRPDGMPEGFDAEEFARAFGGRGRSAGVQFSREHLDLNDVFASLFGGSRPGAGGFPSWETRGSGSWARTRVARGPDMVGTLSVSFAEAALGARRSLRTGSGAVVEVAVPAGVEAGGRLRIPGQGGPPPGKAGTKGQPGDLYLDIEVAPHPQLGRQGFDVEMELPVTVTEAALGAKIEVPTVDGSVTVTVPPGTSSGGRLRLRGRGIRKPDGERGDQYCRVEIAVPRVAPGDTETRGLLEELARRTGGGPVRSW